MSVWGKQGDVGVGGGPWPCQAPIVCYGVVPRAYLHGCALCLACEAGIVRCTKGRSYKSLAWPIANVTTQGVRCLIDWIFVCIIADFLSHGSTFLEKVWSLPY